MTVLESPSLGHNYKNKTHPLVHHSRLSSAIRYSRDGNFNNVSQLYRVHRFVYDIRCGNSIVLWSYSLDQVGSDCVTLLELRGRVRC